MVISYTQYFGNRLFSFQQWYIYICVFLVLKDIIVSTETEKKSKFKRQFYWDKKYLLSLHKSKCHHPWVLLSISWSINCITLLDCSICFQLFPLVVETCSVLVETRLVPVEDKDELPGEKRLLVTPPYDKRKWTESSKSTLQIVFAISRLRITALYQQQQI
jgi:hypothetical protein